MQINEEKPALLSLENMELKLSMVLSLIMPTPRAGARARAQVPCELPVTCSDPAREQRPRRIKGKPQGRGRGTWAGALAAHPPRSEDRTTQDLSTSAKLLIKAFRAGSCWVLWALGYCRAELGSQPGLQKALLMKKMHNFICSAKTLKCPDHLLLSAP